RQVERELHNRMLKLLYVEHGITRSVSNPSQRGLAPGLPTWCSPKTTCDARGLRAKWGCPCTSEKHIQRRSAERREGARRGRGEPRGEFHPEDRDLPRSLNELGCLAGSAWDALRGKRHERMCAPARQTVKSIQWGICACERQYRGDRT